MKQSNPKLTKINYIAQVTKNIVGQNGTKLTKVTGTQSNEMKHNEPNGAKWSKVVQNGGIQLSKINRNGPMV